MSAGQGDRAGYQSTRITTGTTTPIKTSQGTIHGVFVEVTTTGIVTFNETVSGSTVAVMIWPLGIPVGFHRLELAFSGKVEVVTAAADRIVVLYD